jgi:hypothetical protein
MTKPFPPPLLVLGAFLLLPILFCSSCRGSPATVAAEGGLPDAGGSPEGREAPADSGSSPGEQPLSPEEETLRALFSAFEAAPGVGIFTRDPRDPAQGLEAEEREGISLSFRAAYAEALGRGFPLEGVLGGDRVHAWPAGSALAWVQNWKTAEAYPNSWGLPDLVLAIRGFDAARVFIVRGAVLDLYGKSGGRGGANGVAGYGPPLSDEFPYGEGIAQRFGKGLITVDAAGHAAFIPDEPAPGA